MAIVQEMIRQREQDARERAEQLKTLKEKSVFTYSLQDDCLCLEAFQDVCLVVKPN